MSAPPHPGDHDLAVIGGGPAGQAAAEVAGRAGLSVVVVDEQARPGGQILRQPPAAFRVSNWLPGGAYRNVKRQLARFEALPGLSWLGRHSVLGLFPAAQGFKIVASGADGVAAIRARRVLIAGGCYDLPMPLPGWTLPGVMSAGGVQAFVKSQLFVPGERFVFAGTHPLQLVVAAQILDQGGRVDAVLFAQPLRHFLAAAAARPLVALRGAPAFLSGAVAMTRLRRAGVPVRFDAPVTMIDGGEAVDGVRWAGPSPGEARCDRVALCFGFVPQSDLVRMAGARVCRIPDSGGWRAMHDEWMRSTVPGLSVAGETTGVGGAETALCEGHLAGLGIAMDHGALPAREARRRAVGMRRRLKARRAFAALLDRMATPGPMVADMGAETIVCRCENVTYGALRGALAGEPAPRSANVVKLLTRAGMGLCQGRGCEHSVLRMMREAQGAPEADGTGYTARFPTRPASIGDLVALRCDLSNEVRV